MLRSPESHNKHNCSPFGYILLLYKRSHVRCFDVWLFYLMPKFLDVLLSSRFGYFRQ